MALTKESNMKKLRKFKLIDREGYINAGSDNEDMLQSFFVEGTVEGYMDRYGYLMVEGCEVIFPVEFKFFEEVFDVVADSGNQKEGKMVNDTNNVHETLLNHLLAMKEIQYDCLWVTKFNSWDSGDCSQVGLLNVYTVYLIENQTGGIFGERDSSIYDVSDMNEFIEEHFVD